MHPNFYEQLNLKDGGYTVEAGGPIDWEDGDESIKILNVTVEQNDVVALSDQLTTVRKGVDRDWWLDVTSSNQFTRGPALASGVAIVRRADGTTREYSWPDAIQIDMPLKLEEIQGNVVAGFNKDHTSFLLFALPDDRAQARAWLADLVDEVATADEVQRFNDLFRTIRKRRRGREGVVEAAWMNLALTHEGLAKLGVDQSHLRQFPQEFREGMRKRNRILGDVGDNDPEQWPNDLGKRPIHALMIIAADSLEDLKREALYFIRHAASHGVSLVFQQEGMTRPDAPGHEHFGYRDGVSQPSIRGLTASSYPDGSDGNDSSQDVIAAGEFVLGYPRERPPDPGDNPMSPEPGWTHNGSYLVFRRLQQDVKGFRDFVAGTARLNMSADLFGAKLVGRYQSGAPLMGAGNAAEDPGTTDPSSLHKDKINAFGYATDPQGTQVPRAAHIRKTYPRDEQASGKELAERPRILRRGIPFGQSFRHGHPPRSPFGADPPFPDDRGLCFVSYQRSIRDQFERIQCTWVNKEGVPEAGDGVDPVASQAAGERRMRIPGAGANPVHLPRWVRTTGGEYFFSPSISALELLSGKEN
jgi:Dyp-type peroxidase family